MASAILAAVASSSAPLSAEEALASRPLPEGSERLAAEIDSRLQTFWQQREIHTAGPSSDAEFIRRITLDLAGRIPTRSETQAFLADPSAEKRMRRIELLLASPEYALHFGAVLDGFIQDRYAGDAEFLAFLRQTRREGLAWDDTFRRIMLGPWESEADGRAAGFLRKRIRSIDELTNDTAKVFFGVNVGCAKCHDHPLVPDWKQAHFYGMQAFLSRTYEDKGKKQLLEKKSGEVQFTDVEGKQHTAQLMFLSGEVVEPPKGEGKDQPPFSPRAELVQLALAQKAFFSRAAVNYIWAGLMGRGLVEPLDQLHSGNAPSVPGLLEWLAEDFSDHGYNLERLVAGIVQTQAYQHSSRWQSAATPPGPEHFAIAAVRPLTPRQFALSLLLATGDESFSATQAEDRLRAYLSLEGQSQKFAASLTPASSEFQASVAESLFMANHADVYALTAPKSDNLAARLIALDEPGKIVDEAVLTILSRPAEPDERQRLIEFVTAEPDRAAAVRDLIWALLTSGEFRFAG